MKTLSTTVKKRLFLASLGVWMVVFFALVAPTNAQAHGRMEMYTGGGYLGYFGPGNRIHGLNFMFSFGLVLSRVEYNGLTAKGFGLFHLEQNLGGGLKGYDGFVGSTIFSTKIFFPIVDEILMLGTQFGIGAAYSRGKTAFDLDKDAFALKLGLNLSIPVADGFAIGADFSYFLCARKGYIGHIITPSLHFRFAFL